MPALSVKHSLSVILSVLLIFTPFLTARQHLLVGVALGLTLLLFGLAATGYTIALKHWERCRQGHTPRSISIRNICLEIAAVLTAMVVAGMTGRYLSTWAGGGMDDYIRGIGAGLLVGWAVGLLVKWMTGRLMKS